MADTPESMIARHQQIKAHLEQQTKAFAEYCKTYKEEQASIEAWLLNFLNETKQNSAKTDAGTAYKSTLTQPKVMEREKFLDWVLADWDSRGAMLQIGAPQVGEIEAHIDRRKKEIEAHVAEHGGLPEDPSVTPPGTAVTYFTRLNIRKS